MTDPALMVIESNKERFRFSGKELDGQNGLNMYDFGARLFDVAGVTIWTSVDPLAEKNTSITPYSYCNGDPVNRFDPDGNRTFNVFGSSGECRTEIINGLSISTMGYQMIHGQNVGSRKRPIIYNPVKVSRPK